MSARAHNSGALALESLARPNLLVVDWHTMVEANRAWLVDPVHVNPPGNVARAAAVAAEVRACRKLLSGPPAPGPLPA
jgi:hypothetical protein